MGLGIYAGPLTRYYARDFETTDARLAREQGAKHRIIHDTETLAWPTASAMPPLIAEFRTRVAEQTGPAYPQLARWREDVSVHRAEQLPHHCHKALVLVAAYTERPDLTRPSRLPDMMDDDPAYREAAEKGYYRELLAVFEATMFLPGDEQVLLAMQDPIDQPVIISTTGALKSALETLQSRLWQDAAQARSWFERGPQRQTAGSKAARGWHLPWQKKESVQGSTAQTDSLMHNAEYAFGCFSEMLGFAQEHHVPIRLDA